MSDPKQTATAFAAALRDTFGERLRGVLLYGSVARGEAIPGASDINVLVLLDRIDADVLTAGSPLARRWSKAGNAAPLFMAEDEWRRAADVFAIELADMRDAHEVLHGPDPLASLEVDRAALRLQTERELRGKLLQLREGMLLAAEEEEAVGRLLMVALPSFVTYLRATLRLAGRDAPLRTPDVLEEAGRLLEADPSPLARVWEARNRRQPIRVGVGDPLTRGYYALAERTAAFVDHLSEPRTQ
ncbi:MAG TPA: nucleotidyltransferase domain-containing protein [Longimicrobiales bacterium]